MAKTEYSEADDSYILKKAGKKSWEEIGVKLGVSRHAARGRYLTLTGRRESEMKIPRNEIEWEKTGNTEVITAKSATIRTAEDLLKECKVDLSVWEIEKQVCNKWDGFARTRSYKHDEDDWRRELTAVELFQVKVWLRRKSKELLATEQLKIDLVNDVKKHAPQYPKIIRPKIYFGDRKLMLEASMFDHHFGKLAWAPETGSNYDLKIAVKEFDAAGEDFLHRVEGQPIHEILVPIGNDLFHVDNDKNETTNGTLQDCDGRWQKAFRAAKECITRFVDNALNISRVKLIVVPGNHDRERTFLLGEVLAAHYRHARDVQIDNTPTLRKYHQFGTCLLGFTHGCDERHQELPLTMAVEKPDLWAVTTHREWHIGHYHKKKKTEYNAGDTHKGVVVRILPSLCGTDAWHHRKGYVKGPRASEAYLWDFTHGYVGHMSHNAINN
jgi:hypothetical protein